MVKSIQVLTQRPSFLDGHGQFFRMVKDTSAAKILANFESIELRSVATRIYTKLC